MGANMQPQGQVQILVNLIDRDFDLQQALDAPRVRALDGRQIFVERHQDQDFADKLAALGHQVVAGEEIPADWMLRHDFLRSLEGCAQAIAIAGEGPVRRLGPAAGRHRGAALAIKGGPEAGFQTPRGGRFLELLLKERIRFRT
jgi:gamma-glutamyltranspeptidase